MSQNVPSPFMPECWKCHGQKWERSIENFILYFYWMEDQKNGGRFVPVCCGCIWDELKQHGFEAPPSSRKRYYREQFEARQNSKEGNSDEMITSEMMGEGWIKAEDLPENGYKEKVKTSTIDTTGQFGPRVKFVFKDGVTGKKNVSLNATSLGLWVKKYGKDESEFVGKTAKLSAREINGKECVICEPA